MQSKLLLTSLDLGRTLTLVVWEQQAELVQPRHMPQHLLPQVPWSRAGQRCLHLSEEEADLVLPRRSLQATRRPTPQEHAAAPTIQQVEATAVRQARNIHLLRQVTVQRRLNIVRLRRLTLRRHLNTVQLHQLIARRPRPTALLRLSTVLRLRHIPLRHQHTRPLHLHTIRRRLTTALRVARIRRDRTVQHPRRTVRPHPRTVQHPRHTVPRLRRTVQRLQHIVQHRRRTHRPTRLDRMTILFRRMDSTIE
mmetsp:Transcript_231/g.289  ORF Transcript_231/g.289 Transcript_231/m.289 type:complete len:251 (+) Transcript_231:2588-3340(+)